jgi:hypothetical protein
MLLKMPPQLLVVEVSEEVKDVARSGAVNAINTKREGRKQGNIPRENVEHVAM